MYCNRKSTLIICVLVAAFLQHAGAQIISTVAGIGTPGYSGDGGPATVAQFQNTYGFAFDTSGNLFVVDGCNFVVRKITPSGTITTVAGNGYGAGCIGSGGYTGDGGAATAAELSTPNDVAFDKWGNMYVVEHFNHTIRKVNTSGIISTIAGTGTIAGYTGDGGPATAATLNEPAGISIDTSGNLYITDQMNDAVRKVNTSGVISTFAGTGSMGYSGDGGPATNAKFYQPTSLALDKHGNLFVADVGNNCVRKIDPAGTITTVAGTGAAGYSGDGGMATSALLNWCTGVFVDVSDNIYISDYSNNVIRKVDASGIITTVAGSGVAGYSGDGGAATAAKLNNPWVAKPDAYGNLYLADCLNNVVRKIGPGTPESLGKPLASDSQIFPNPATNEIIVQNAPYGEVFIYNLFGELVYRALISSNNQVLNISSLHGGVYIVCMPGKNGDRHPMPFVKE
jgi:trimeric autotransporter adhesin